jgi:8-oxo-dGTP pyrophosphatase MutT (NUDIX family)
VLVVDEDDRVLLFFSSGFVAPGVEYYVTVGGGIDPGESLAEAAARELFEETGLRVAPEALGPVVAQTEGEWSDNPAELVLQEDLYFFYRAPHFDPPRDGLGDVELRELTEARWLTVAEVEQADPIIFPARIADLLKGLVAGTVPQAPVRLPWRAWTFDPGSGWTVIDRFGILGQ